MFSSKNLTVRLSNRIYKQKARRILFDLAHTKNLWILLIKKYKELYNHYPTDISILYGLIADREYKPKKEDRLEKFKEIQSNIENGKELSNILSALKEQKAKIGNASLVQQVIRSVSKSFQDYRKAYKDYLRYPDKYKSPPKPPKPKKLKYLMSFSVELNANTFKRVEDTIEISIRKKPKETIKLKLPHSLPDVRSIRLKLYGSDIYADVIYKTTETRSYPIGEYTASIDLGLNNLIALFSTNPELKSLIVSGRELKAFNQWFNKKKAKLQSEIDLLKNDLKKKDDQEKKQKLIFLTIKQKELSAYRKRKIDNDFHKISRKIVDILLSTGHSKLFVGKGATESKNSINIGKRNNQSFVSIPFRKLINLIKYKAQSYGIEVIEVDEAFTSKTSPFADLFKVRETGKEYLKLKEKDDKDKLQSLKTKLKILTQATRKKRGLLEITLNGSKKALNADLVGAYNIARAGEHSPRLLESLKALFVKLCNPVKAKLVDFLYQVTPDSLRIGGSGSHCGAGLSPFNHQKPLNFAVI